MTLSFKHPGSPDMFILVCLVCLGFGHGTPIGGRRRAPAPKCPGERARIGITEKQGNLDYFHLGIFQQLPGDIKANPVCHLLKVGAQCIQMTIERASVHRKEFSNLFR